MNKLSDYKKNSEGMDFLRNLVDNFNCRSENLNENKTPNQLINEYLKYTNDEIDLDGNKLNEFGEQIN